MKCLHTTHLNYAAVRLPDISPTEKTKGVGELRNDQRASGVTVDPFISCSVSLRQLTPHLGRLTTERLACWIFCLPPTTACQ